MKKLVVLNIFLALVLAGCGDSFSPSESQPFADETENEAMIDAAGIVGAEAFSKNDLGLRATVALVNVGNGQLFCTGALINSRLVLTAAHCVQTGITAGFGVRFFDGSIVEYDLGLRHARYGLTKNEDDIALIHLKKSAPASAQIAQIPRTALKPGSYKTRAFGIGRTAAKANDSGEMRMVNLQGAVTSSRPQFLQYKQSNGKGVCKGDSGGPHFIYNKGQPVVVAITTQAENVRDFWGSEVEDYCRRTSIATLTGRYFDWISQAAKVMTE